MAHLKLKGPMHLGIFFIFAIWHAVTLFRFGCIKQFEKCARCSLQNLYEYFLISSCSNISLNFLKDITASSIKTIEFLCQRNCLRKMAPKFSLCNWSTTETKQQALSDWKVGGVLNTRVKSFQSAKAPIGKNLNCPWKSF